MQVCGVNTVSRAVGLASRAADSTNRLRVSVLAGYAEPRGRINRTATWICIHALASRVEELLRQTGLEEDALALLQSVVFIDTLRAEADAVDLEAVFGKGQTLSIHAPLISPTSGL